MAFSKIQYNKSLEHGRALHDALTQIEGGTNNLVQVLGAMTRMIDGDGSSSSHFTEVVSRYGVEGVGVDDAAKAADALARAKSMKDEVASFLGKLTTDGSVDHVDAARRQVMDILR